ncbi:chromatin-binding protein RAD9 [Aspergillus clavatus NRRL 1]|uniref:BRCT domain protein n=1 Tax=Aspergillus clavatus (strain ATCC 1007 / CBS 513.65 / DSM 816 / NCTC 3887 / NRRL 1 / QM 1276 / 107) TaxID=344612 RepID=A1C4T6_ASPCL|nr:BRCT domain protein [Aspergillus clavatus NRRL 1]EAW14704.1 BRCT domain protein [Aspergillus clavatus NRRL 1]
METQNDSIDIVKLQRVALGLDLAPSQLLLDDLESIDNHQPRYPLNDCCENINTTDVPAPSPDHQVIQPSPQELVPRSEDDPIISIDANRESESGNIRHDPQPVRHTAKMSSADAVPSDTQVVSQSVFDDMIKQNKDAARNILESNLGDRATLVTLHEGDSGHLDLLSGFENTCPDTINAEDNEDQSSSRLGESSPLHFQPNLFPESQRFLTSTPATALKTGRTQNSNSETPSMSKNPLATDIQSSGGVMALSQVFRATQAPSSPLVHGQHPDLMSDRPSPNIPIQSHPLATALSSPLNNLAATFPQDHCETPMAYISMKESQARRDRILQERMTRSAEYIHSEDQSDGEFDKEPSFVERIIRQRNIDQEATAQFAGLAAPPRPLNRRQTGDRSLPLPEKPQQERQIEVPRSPVSADEAHKLEAGLQTSPISEAETEGDEEPAPSRLPPHTPNSSTEEDKENHDNVSGGSRADTASAHKRLSRALSSQDGSASPKRSSAKGIVCRPGSPDLADLDGTRESSQIVIVKDSQQSPRHEDNEDQSDDAVHGRRNHRHMSQASAYNPGNPRKRYVSFPTKSPQICSSPPPSDHGDVQKLHRVHHNPSATRSRSNSASSHEASSQLPRNLSSAQEVIITQSSNFLGDKPTGIADKDVKFDTRDKPSSMPSRVAETPVPQHLKDFGDGLPATSIPETSPNRLHNRDWVDDTGNDPMDQDDDDLPPTYAASQGRVSLSQPLVPESSTPVKRFQTAKILSSPSGRQRRALTEIAADASPQAGTGHFDLDIGILTADDKEFSSVVSMSPIPPRKRRRGNGQSVYASDPVVPFTPRTASQCVQASKGERTVEKSPSPARPVETSESSLRKRYGPPKRMGTLWEVEDTPQYHVSRKERLKRVSQPRLQAQPEPPAQKPVVNTAIKIVEVHDTGNPTLPSAEDGSESRPDPSEFANDEESVQAKSAPSNNAPIATNQVIAPWSGPKRAYYPATCVGKSPSVAQSKILVKFEDSVPIEVPLGAVKRLELRIGDAVKVDMPNVPKVTHIIRGFQDKLSPEDLAKAAADGIFPITDVYGHTVLLLGPKQRKSLPTSGLTGPDNVIKVPISRIYLDTILWNQLKDRAFAYDSGAAPLENRLQTPSERHSTPVSPGSRLSRSIRLLNGLFAGMVFAVSYGDNDEVKSRITKMILENDGSILKDGFNELFEMSSYAPLATPTKPSTQDANSCSTHFRLAGGAEEVGFACLIADKHSRRPKYMQALALNIPCLSDRWIEDCLAQNRILDWELYLLPSGESLYLNGATKSRFLAPYPATAAQLPITIAARPNLLQGQSVLLVMGRGGRADEERRKAYIFLTYALGASKVERVPDLKSVRAILDQQAQARAGCTWDWIYVDGDDMATAKAMILGLSTLGSLKSQSFRGPKKRKRTELIEFISGGDLGLSNNVRIVGNEFVCQSLILGKLFEQ